MKSKKGSENMVYHSIFSIFIIILILGLMLLFIVQRANEEIRPDVLAKDLCVISLSKTNTQIVIETNYIISKLEEGISIQKDAKTPGYIYPCNGNFDLEEISDGTYLMIIK